MGIVTHMKIKMVELHKKPLYLLLSKCIKMVI
jgi:hypothetical protein